MVGRDRSELVGSHINAILPSAGRIFYSTHVFPLLRLHGRAEELYMPLLHAEGSQVPMLANGRSRAEGEAAVHDLVFVPMRQRSQLESQLIEARNAAVEAAAAKDRFLSVVSHELRSPLAGISGYAELLLRERKGPLADDQRRYVKRIHEAARYQLRLIEDILDFASIDERNVLTTIPLEVEEVLSRAESILTLRAREEGRRLRRQPPRPAKGTVRADPRAVQQILLNLGTNAIKYGRPKSRITLGAQAAGGRIQLTVSDEGEGIAPDQLERIFEPFIQLAPAGGSSNSRKGVGLGLSISRDLARAMGGDLTVESLPGTGSRFTLELPAASSA
jgi:signal transduction histidine kinase